MESYERLFFPTTQCYLMAIQQRSTQVDGADAFITIQDDGKGDQALGALMRENDIAPRVIQSNTEFWQ